MRWMSMPAAAFLLTANVLVWSCSDWDEDHHDDWEEDVAVDVTGDAGLEFDGRFEDDHHVQHLSGAVPFSADFQDQAGFFQAVVEKRSGGAEQICVRISSPHDAKQSCTTAPWGQVSATLAF